MKLFHYVRRDGVENFGDRLNLWLWPQLIPDLLSMGDSTTFVGTGTLLNHRLPDRLRSDHAVIFSTGAGYERPLRSLPETWRIYCVRGPLSAQRLGLSPETAIADGGLLIARCFHGGGEKRVPVAVMPHIHHATAAGDRWENMCQELGWGYIDPRWSVEAVLEAIDQSKLLLAEAMHGAISADALRVPWIPITTSARILPFKWRDWCASIGVPYRPQYLPPLACDYPPVAQGVRSGSRAAMHWQHCWRQGRFAGSPQAIAAALLTISRTQTPHLSSSATLERLLARLEAQLERLQEDMARDRLRCV